MNKKNKFKKSKIKSTLKTSIGTQSDHITTTQANQIRALVITSEAGTQVNPRTGNIETQTSNRGSTNIETQTNK